jgi:hypothetical protein
MNLKKTKKKTTEAKLFTLKHISKKAIALKRFLTKLKLDLGDT